METHLKCRVVLIKLFVELSGSGCAMLKTHKALRVAVMHDIQLKQQVGAVKRGPQRSEVVV